MSEKNDDGTKNAEPSQTPDCKSGTQCHQQDWNAIAREGNTVSPPNYEAALDEIRRSHGIIRQCAKYNGWRAIAFNAALVNIDEQLKAVNK